MADSHKKMISHEKMIEVVEIIQGLDSLDVKAWEEITRKLERDRVHEQAVITDEAIEKSHSTLAGVLPLMKLVRLMIASEAVSPQMRVIVVRTLLNELLPLLSPIEAAGILTSAIHSTFERSKPPMPIPMMIVASRDDMSNDRDEIEGNRLVI